MKKTIEEMKTENGYFVIGGHEYILTEQAYFQCDTLRGLDGWDYDNYYCARAICPDDKPDEDGCQKCYKVRWEILDSYDPEYMGEDCACDWYSPSGIAEQGEYNLEVNRYY